MVLKAGIQGGNGEIYSQSLIPSTALAYEVTIEVTLKCVVYSGADEDCPHVLGGHVLLDAFSCAKLGRLEKMVLKLL